MANCPYSVEMCFETNGLDIDEDNWEKLNSLKLRKFAPILSAVLECEICSLQGGRPCKTAVSLDVVEVGICRNIMTDEQLTSYFGNLEDNNNK